MSLTNNEENEYYLYSNSDGSDDDGFDKYGRKYTYINNIDNNEFEYKRKK